MKDATHLKNLLTAMATLIDEARFFVTADKISLREMDPSRVAMVDFEWPKTAFDEYNADSATICINISELLKLLRAGKEDSLQLSLNEETGKLIITIKGKYTRTFNMPTLEPGEEEVPVPKVTFNVNARLDVAALNDAFEDASLVSDHVKFEASENDKLIINAQGDLMGAAIEFQRGNDALLALEIKEPSKATFSLAYLSEICKACTSLAAVATVEFSTDMPVRLNFEQKEGQLIYYLAPRIEVE